MRILIVNKFLYHVGGVESYVLWLAERLVSAGHEVAVLGMAVPFDREMMTFPGAVKTYFTPYWDFNSQRSTFRMASAAHSLYSRRISKLMAEVLDHFRPDAIHYHMTAYHLTSAVVRAANDSTAGRIATMHEYKLACANYRLWDDRQGRICTQCVGQSGLARMAAPLR